MFHCPPPPLGFKNGFWNLKMELKFMTGIAKDLFNKWINNFYLTCIWTSNNSLNWNLSNNNWNYCSFLQYNLSPFKWMLWINHMILRKMTTVLVVILVCISWIHFWFLIQVGLWQDVRLTSLKLLMPTCWDCSWFYKTKFLF